VIIKQLLLYGQLN